MSSLPTISQTHFESVEDLLLLQTVFDSSLSKIRGRDYKFKRTILDTLTKGQKSLFMFISIYHHNTMGWESFMSAFSLYFPDGYFDDIKEGITYLEDMTLLSILEECESIFYCEKDDSLKMREYKKLDDKYEFQKEKSLTHSVDFVRKRSEEFVIFSD